MPFGAGDPVTTSTIVGTAELINTNMEGMLMSLNNPKRRLTAQFNEAKRKEDEEKGALIEFVAKLYSDLVELNVSIEQQKRERKALAEANRQRDEQAYLQAFEDLVKAMKASYQVESEGRRRVLEAISIDLEEQQTVLRSKQSAQLASLNPPRELTKSILLQTFAVQREVAEAEALASGLSRVIDVEKVRFERDIIECEGRDRNTIFDREEARLMAEKREQEGKLLEVRKQMAMTRDEHEMALATLRGQQRQLQGDSEVCLHEIRQLERRFDEHEKDIALRKFKKTAAYKVQLVQNTLTSNLISKPLAMVANVAKTTSEAIIPHHKPPPSTEELERRSEERRQLRDQCTAYLEGLKNGIATVEEECAWMEEQTEMIRALLHNDELSIEQLSARIREIIARKRPVDEGEDEEGESTLNFTTSRRSVSSTNFSGF